MFYFIEFNQIQKNIHNSNQRNKEISRFQVESFKASIHLAGTILTKHEHNSICRLASYQLVQTHWTSGRLLPVNESPRWAASFMTKINNWNAAVFLCLHTAAFSYVMHFLKANVLPVWLFRIRASNCACRLCFIIILLTVAHGCRSAASGQQQTAAFPKQFLNIGCSLGLREARISSVKKNFLKVTPLK